MFDRQPTLVGFLLRLRPLRPEDWSELFAVASDPLIWAQHPDSDRYKEDVFRQFFNDALASGGALVAIERSSGWSSSSAPRIADRGAPWRRSARSTLGSGQTRGGASVWCTN